MSRTATFSCILSLPVLLLVVAGCGLLPFDGNAVSSNHPTLPPSPTLPPPTPTTPPTDTPQPTTPPTLTITPDIPACNETQGRIIYTSFSSQITGHEFRYRIYLPPCYAVTERRYPYIIMLHGLGEGMDDSQWEDMGLLEAADLGYSRGALPPMIIVMPNGNDAQHGYDPAPYPQVIVEELMPTLAASFCTWNEPHARAIGGLSRGGYWAFGIAFTYPDLFDRVGGHSAFFYEGDYTPFNPTNMLETASGIERLAMYLDHGANDSLVDENVRSFVNLLRRRGIEPEYVVNPVGGHDENYWASHTADYLAFYAAQWPHDVHQFPSCHDPSPPNGGE
jgi:enterochelin esterase-like enzyme